MIGINMYKFRLSLAFIFVLFLFSWINSKKNHKIFDSNGEKILIDHIVQSLDTSSILIYGEEHDDSITHLLELEILQELYKVHGKHLVLSLEMFDHDVQPIMNEYLSGLIKESYFKKDARAWSNYKDYRPLVEFAKEKQLEVICANAPFRYANLVSVKGMDTLQQISNLSKSFLPPLPFPLASDKYRNKLIEALGDYAKRNDSTGYDLLRGQALWNSSMAYWITRTLKQKPQAKVFHVNGKLHSNHRLGVPEKLDFYKKGLQFNTTIISTSNVEKLPRKLQENSSSEADILIYTSK